MYACMTPVGFDTSDKFENHCCRLLADGNSGWLLFGALKKLCMAELFGASFFTTAVIVRLKVQLPPKPRCCVFG